MSVSLAVHRSSRGRHSVKLSCFAILACWLASAGCVDRNRENKTGSSSRGDKLPPTFDVRGGTSDSAVILNARTLFEGTGGEGGSLRVSTSGGNITINQNPIATAPQLPTLLGNGFDVASGEKRRVAGAYVVNWLRVQQGGILELAEDTLFIVLGDVVIDGYVKGRGDAHAIDGKDLTIDADGIVNITGTVDCGGFEVDPNKQSPTDRVDLAGGKGGEIYISSAEGVGVSPGPHIFITGLVRSDGGDSFSQAADTAHPGKGGQILIGTQGLLSIAGRISAHGGQCYFNSESSVPDGGSIQLVAVGNIEIGKVREISANGGACSGAIAGKGGSILLEAPVGTLDFDNFDIECRGGRTTFAVDGSGGEGGVVTLTAATVGLSGMTIDTTGGDAVLDDRGEGGPGGTTQIAGTTAIVVAPDVIILSDGGETHATGLAGGAGGGVKVVNINEADVTALDFEGSATVEGGKDAVHSTGQDGEVCAAGSNTASNLKLVGTNNFPISQCTASDVEDLLMHDLDCDDATIRPDSVSTELPAITGVAFYRLVKTAGMVADGVTTVTVTLTGEAGGNINLYAGPAGVLGSTNTGDYPDQSTEADSNETLDVDVSGLGVGGFISIFVDEAFTFVEAYTITVSCS